MTKGTIGKGRYRLRFKDTTDYWEVELESPTGDPTAYWVKSDTAPKLPEV